MSTVAIVVLLATALAAAFVQGASGLGFALVLGPVAGLVQPDILPVALLVLMLPLNSYVLWRERQHIDVRGASWVTAARLAATPLGIGLLTVVPANRLGILIGGSTIVAAGVSLFGPSFMPGRTAFVGAGVITGVSETATGIGGPPLALVYQHRPAPELRATLALCFVVGEVASLIGLASTHRLFGPGLGAALWLLPAVTAGTLLSSHVHRRSAAAGFGWASWASPSCQG